MNAFYEQMAAHGGNSDRNFRAVLTGKPLTIATSAQLEVAGALSMHPRASLPARFASLDPPCDACSLVRFMLPRQRLIVSHHKKKPSKGLSNYK